MSRNILPSLIWRQKILKKGGEYMKKIDLLDPKIVKLINECSEEILQIVDNQDKFTRSDLQGAVDALVIKILQSGLELN